MFRILQRAFIAIAFLMLMGHNLVSHSHQHEKESAQSINRIETNNLISYLRDVFSNTGDDKSLEETQIQNNLRVLKDLSDHCSGLILFKLDSDYTLQGKIKLSIGSIPLSKGFHYFIQFSSSVIPVRGSPVHIS